MARVVRSWSDGHWRSAARCCGDGDLGLLRRSSAAGRPELLCVEAGTRVKLVRVSNGWGYFQRCTAVSICCPPTTRPPPSIQHSTSPSFHLPLCGNMRLLLQVALAMAASVLRLCLSTAEGSQHAHPDMVSHLPGQPQVSFRQFSGYVTVDERKERALFYYFAEAEVDPLSKPLVLWLNGGNGCSSVGVGAYSEGNLTAAWGSGRGLEKGGTGRSGKRMLGNAPTSQP